MPQDLWLNDGVLENEIHLVGKLVLAASRSAGPLPQEAIDAVLGLEPAGQAEQAEQAVQPEPDPAEPDPAEPDPGTRHREKGFSL